MGSPRVPAIPAPPLGTLFGANSAGPQRVPVAVSEEHSDRERAAKHRELLQRFDLGGGPSPDEPPTSRRGATFGPAPIQQRRRVFVAKFNPAESDPGRGRFDSSDPHADPTLWDFNAAPSSWIGDWGLKTVSELSAISGGDLVFVQRSIPRTDNVPVSAADPFAGRKVLLGVWWVTHVHRRWLADHRHRPTTSVWHAPLVRFDTGGEVDVRVVRRHPELERLAPFIDQRRAGLVATSPVEAAALVAACGLPSWVLTDPDPVDLAVRLGQLSTGMSAGDLAYARDARARYRHIHDIETAATAAVAGQLTSAGWSVMSRERYPRWGADLAAVRESAGRREERAVEVKGKRGPRWSDVVLQQSQYDRACASAAAADDEWWLAVCPNALAAGGPPLTHQLPASWVASHWPTDRVRPAGRWAGPHPDDFL